MRKVTFLSYLCLGMKFFNCFNFSWWIKPKYSICYNFIHFCEDMMIWFPKNWFSDFSNVTQVASYLWTCPGPFFWAKYFFRCNDCLHQLDSIVVYHNMQNQQKLSQTRKNGQKPLIWAILGPFGPILGREIFFSKIGLCYSF